MRVSLLSCTLIKNSSSLPLNSALHFHMLLWISQRVIGVIRLPITQRPARIGRRVGIGGGVEDRVLQLLRLSKLGQWEGKRGGATRDGWYRALEGGLPLVFSSGETRLRDS